MKQLSITMYFLIGSLVIIAGCGASKQAAMLRTINSPQSRPATFEALDEDMRAAERDGVNLISTAKFQFAKSELKEAQDLRDQGQSESKYLEHLKESRQALDSATIFANENRDRMAPLIQARANTIELTTPETKNPKLESLEKKYLELVKDLNDSGSKRRASKEIPVLTHEYQTLSMALIEARYLGEALNNIELAKSEDAKKLAPKTLRETEDLIIHARAVIAEDQGSEALPKIAEVSQEALVGSRRLLSVTRQTSTNKNLSPEDISLKTEGMVNSANADESALKNRLNSSQNKVKDLEKRTEKYSELERKDSVNQKYESVHALFDESEAKVYRQGDNLVIRLKKINFAANQNEIPSESFGLLKKVQTAIKSFSNPSLIIEGHTDSLGGSALNKGLSETRAEAVKEYFLSNNILSADSMVTIGYGSEKPLASNKSSEGRAINRRIDIVIKESL